jgi:hypothetical protein
MWKVVEKKDILSSWILWHYVISLEKIYRQWKDFLKFNMDYFSIPFLLKTIFSPWKKYKISYGKGFDIAKIFEALTFNVFSRFIGAGIRTLVILFGLLSQFLIIFFGIFIILFWIILPLVTAFGIFILLQWLIFT